MGPGIEINFFFGGINTIGISPIEKNNTLIF